MTDIRDSSEKSKVRIPVLIVGAGPTGLVLALWLTRLGVAVRIIDKTAEPGTTSRALAVQARTLEFYRQLGIADAVVAGGVKIAGVNLWVKGRRAARVPLQKIGEGRTPFPFALVFPQDAHERLLIDRLEALGVKVERSTELVRFDQHSAGVHAALKRPDGTEDICEAGYLAGCDGARSTVRESLAIGFPGGTYAGLFYVADVVAAGPVTNYELHVDLDESDLLIVFPMQGPGCVRLVGTVGEKPGKADHEWKFDDVSSRAIQHLKLDVAKVNWFSTYRVHHRVADCFGKGRAFLLGDAAHIHSPVGGQGMNTGIGDAVNLAWKLAAVLEGAAAASLLETYEPERIGFARRLVATTDRGFTLVTAQGRLARFVRTRLVPIFLPLLFRLRGMRNFLFRTVSQTGIQYRASPLSAGRAGDLHSGDRLPWIETGPVETGPVEMGPVEMGPVEMGAVEKQRIVTGPADSATAEARRHHDNFAPLTSLTWQVHIYGDPHAGVAEACAALNLPLHSFAWRPDMRQSGILRSAMYLVRPDGYIALADPEGDPTQLAAYFTSHGLRDVAAMRGRAVPWSRADHRGG